MYKNYKVVCNTAAGRRRYMQYLVPYILASNIVDRYDIWINTHDVFDIIFFKQLASIYSKINLIWQPEGIVNGNKSINAFYKQCIEENTIYFKLDDDIIWMEPGLIEKMVDFRLRNPNYFLVTPLVINNALSTYLLQVCGKIQLNSYYSSSASHPVLWKNEQFAAEIHQWFINNYLRNNRYTELYLGKHDMGLTRFSINSILWFGDEMKKFSGIVPGDDEEFLSCIYPSMKGYSNAWNGDAIVAHFAFFTQRKHLDKQSILEEYSKYIIEEWKKNSTIYSIHLKVQKIMENINHKNKELIHEKSPYKSEKKKSKVKKITYNATAILNRIKNKIGKTRYIIDKNILDKIDY